MAEYTGSGFYLKFNTTVLSPDYRSFSEEHTQDSVEASAGSDTRRTYLATLTDGNLSVDMVAQAAGTAMWSALTPGTSGSIEWGPEGTASGKAKHTATAFVAKRTRDLAYDDIVTLSVEFQFQTAVTDTAY